MSDPEDAGRRRVPVASDLIYSSFWRNCPRLTLPSWTSATEVSWLKNVMEDSSVDSTAGTVFASGGKPSFS